MKIQRNLESLSREARLAAPPHGKILRLHLGSFKKVRLQRSDQLPVNLAAALTLLKST